jgi:type IV pilus assembly protein PilF
MKKLLALVLLPLCACSSHEADQRLTEKADLQYKMAYENFSAGDLIPALSAILDSLKIRPNDVDSKNLLGLIYFRQKKYDEAERVFLEAIKLDGNRSELWVNLGTMYLELKRYPEAEKNLEKALENPLYLYPERIYNNLGLVYQATGRKPAAITAFRRSIELEKEFYLPYQNLGKIYLEMNQLDRAKSLLSDASRLCDTCSQPRYFLGNVLMKENKKEEALNVFKEGAKLDPQSYYGQLCARLVSEDKARGK